MKTVRDFNVKNKRVLVRADFNVPLSEKGEILDDFKIKQTIPTIEYLVERGAKVILMSHLGKPKGKVVDNLRLTPVRVRLMEYLDVSITKASDCIGRNLEKLTHEMMAGEILLLENLRFHKEEEKNNDSFAKELSRLGDIYINDAFSVSHRAHASIVGIPKYLSSGAGLLLEKEIKTLTKISNNLEKPLVAIIGGKKVETRVKLIDKISEIWDWVLIGDLIKKEIKKKNIQLKCSQKIIEPVNDVASRDLSPESINLFKEKIALAKTIFWSGPLGEIEKEEFSKGTEEVARAIIESNAFSVVGGGDTVKFINKLGLREKFNYVSTGGGAMMTFLSGEPLPGLAALEKGEPRSAELSGKP